MNRSLVLLFALPLAVACEDGGLNVFTVDDDISLGQQVRDEILSDPDTYPILDEATYPDAYAHMDRIRDEILATGELTYADEFEWDLYIIDDDETLNAFAAPGGYIWIYTGILRYLQVEDHFAGVMGHEMAHADRRHSTQQLTKIYGIETLLGVVLGEDPGLVAQIAEALVSLKFSRTNEADADDHSVRYLCQTDWAADGAAGFFEQLLEDDSIEIPEFLSTHPSSDTRVEDIHAMAESLGCSTELNPDADWQAVLDSLPAVE